MRLYTLKFIFTLIALTPVSMSSAQTQDRFAVTLPGWTYQPKAQIRDLLFPDIPEFLGILSRRSPVFTPSIFVLRQSMPSQNVENLEPWLNKKYFKGKGNLSWKGPLKDAEFYQGYLYIFATKTGSRTMINLVYSFQLGHELILLSQTSVPSSFKADIKVTGTALKHIKFIK